MMAVVENQAVNDSFLEIVLRTRIFVGSSYDNSCADKTMNHEWELGGPCSMFLRHSTVWCWVWIKLAEAQDNLNRWAVRTVKLQWWGRCNPQMSLCALLSLNLGMTCTGSCLLRHWICRAKSSQRGDELCNKFKHRPALKHDHALPVCCYQCVLHRRSCRGGLRIILRVRTPMM